MDNEIKGIFLQLMSKHSCPICKGKKERIDDAQMREINGLRPLNATHGFQCSKCPFTIFW